MQLELTLDEARLLSAAVEHVKKDKELRKMICASEDDIKTYNAAAGRLRALYLTEKTKP
jgi:hypothetical protein